MGSPLFVLSYSRIHCRALREAPVIFFVLLLCQGGARNAPCENIVVWLAARMPAPKCDL